MEWNLLKDCLVTRRNGVYILKVESIKLWHSTQRPKGYLINREIASGPRGQEFAAFLASKKDGEFYAGDLRLGAGGGYTVPLSRMDFGSDEKRVMDYLFGLYGSLEGAQALIAVVRGQAAPRTQGIDGGGAGIPEILMTSPELIRAACIQENLEEIGITSEKGRIVFTFPEPLRGLGIGSAVDHEWCVLFRNVLVERGVPACFHNVGPPPIDTRVVVNLLAAPDRLIVGDWELDNIGISFEVENASAEVSQLHNIYLPQNSQYGFWDLEPRGTRDSLNRFIAVICKAEKGIFVVFFHKGQYVEGIPAIPLSEEFLEKSMNAKCRKLLSLLDWI